MLLIKFDSVVMVFFRIPLPYGGLRVPGCSGELHWMGKIFVFDVIVVSAAESIVVGRFEDDLTL